MEAVLGCLLIIILVPLVSALGTYLIMFAWNIFMVSVFGLPVITFIQAFALWLIIATLKGLFSITINKN